jgi:FtsP/CotA-like multicopper oxidase with cupredoxin domain
MDRRKFLAWSGAAAASSLIARVSRAGAQDPHAAHGAEPSEAAPRPPPATPPARERSREGFLPVVTPNGETLRWKRDGNVKVGHLVAGEFEHEFVPGLRTLAYGYNGRTPGPTIEAVEGDRVRLYVTNQLPQKTTVHWHGIVLPNGMDGVGGLTQRSIPPGETYVYEFTLRRAGTFMYHPHFDEMTQIALGMTGMFVVHPRRPRGPPVQRDFALMTHEWRIDVGTRRPNPPEMSDFNVLTLNSRSFPGTQPMLVGRGERVRIRLGNLSPQNHHPIHIHGVHFEVTETDGGSVPPGARWPETTVIVPVGSVRVIELVPTESGDWALHCHMVHHMMNQMGHDIPSMVGVDPAQLDRRMARVVPGYMTMGAEGMADMSEMKMPVPPNSIPMLGTPGPFSYIDMGGMVTILKVRDRPREEDRDGWYDHPPGTVAARADPGQMRRDGVDPGRGERSG